jgi:hypothetical protein
VVFDEDVDPTLGIAKLALGVSLDSTVIFFSLMIVSFQGWMASA